MSAVKVETATVYRGGGRRWFSMSAAVNAEAAKLFRDRFKSRCECDDGDHTDYYPGNVCEFHSGNFRERFVRRVARLVAAIPKEPPHENQ